MGRRKTGGDSHPPGPARLRVGTDLMRVERVAESVRRFGSRYLERVYTASELRYCLDSEAEASRRLAARFAAKEAVLKTLQPDGHWLDWRDIEVVRSPGGSCGVRLRGTAQRLAARAGVVELSLSMSHEDQYAVAVVAATLM